MSKLAMLPLVLALGSQSLLAQHHSSMSHSSVSHSSVSHSSVSHGVVSHGSVSASSGYGSFGAGRHRFGILGTGVRSRLRLRSRYAAPYFYAPYFYSDFDYEPYEDERPAPQPEPQTASTPVQLVTNQPLPEPALLELRGTQWVQVNNFGESGQVVTTAPAPSQPPPAVLVYRDGHSEEISSYSIIGRVIYTKADYLASGSATRTIQIVDLDVPATLKQNQQRGVKFELPSGPDEVFIRP